MTFLSLVTQNHLHSVFFVLLFVLDSYLFTHTHTWMQWLFWNREVISIFCMCPYSGQSNDEIKERERERKKANVLFLNIVKWDKLSNAMNVAKYGISNANLLSPRLALIMNKFHNLFKAKKAQQHSTCKYCSSKPKSIHTHTPLKQYFCYNRCLPIHLL